MRVAILGSDGVLGKGIRAWIDQNFQEAECSVFNRARLDLLSQCEIAKFFQAENFDLIFFCAEIRWNSLGDWSAALKNINMTSLFLSEKNREFKQSKLVTFGSAHAYASGSQELFEDAYADFNLSDFNSKPVYFSKSLSFKLFERYAEGLGFSHLHCVLGTIYGGKNESAHLIPSVVREAKRGSAVYELKGKVSARRDYIHIKDASAIICKLALNDVAGVVNIGSGERLDLVTVLDWISRAFSIRIQAPCSSGRILPDQRNLNLNKLKSLVQHDVMYTTMLRVENFSGVE